MSALLTWAMSHLLGVGLAAIVPGAGIVIAAVRYGGTALRFLDTHRKDAVMLLVAIGAAAIYAWGAIGRADRASIVAWADTVCASAGSEYQPAEGKRGAACRSRVADLAKQEHDTAVQSAAILAQAATDREAKATRDAAQARATAADARAAADAMEKANGDVSGDRVGGAWFGALNRVGGLRAPSR